ncbi:MAG: SufD family Fe-S cluster assembly protein [Novosphingobium sp.]|jgi:Fe-S cluster assembly protein SufD|nr:SufD family Fe-S cluster assembly protein [Novosphingobium sp.]
MTGPAPLPTRKAEAFRYADIGALAKLWPLPEPESVVVPAGGSFSRAIVPDAGGVTRLALSIGKGAKAAVHVLNCNGDYGRVELDVTLHESADFTLGGAQLGAGTQTLEIVSTVSHVEPGATSRQTVRSVLAGRATGTCLGRVAVARGADGTDAAQSVRALLLDPAATANARPELEIFADDVKCAHGCAVGELDAQGLFYLQSRGLPLPDARRLMLAAFIAEAFAGAGDGERLERLARERLEALL